MNKQQSFFMTGATLENNRSNLLCSLILTMLVVLCSACNAKAEDTDGTKSRIKNEADKDKPRLGLVIGHAGIDPETGRHDPGFKCPDGLTEVEVNRTIARITGRGLENLGFHVDVLDEFDERLANYRAMALISIHSDACTPDGTEATGFKVAEAMEAGAHERTEKLVDCLAERYGGVTGLTYLAGVVTYDMTDYHTFSEINHETPAAIIEIGNLSIDREFLTRQPDNAARAIIAGIQCYIYQQPVFDFDTPSSF